MVIFGEEIRQMLTTLPNLKRMAADAQRQENYAIGQARAVKGTSMEDGAREVQGRKIDASKVATKAWLDAEQKLVDALADAFKEVEGWNAGDDIEKAPDRI